MFHLSTNFYEFWVSSFLVILATNKQTKLKTQPYGRGNTHRLDIVVVWPSLFTWVTSVLHELTHVVPHREHDQVHWKPWQPAFPYSHDHSWPGEWGQGLAPGEEPRARRPEGGRPRQQDGLWDLPDKTSGYQGEPSVWENPPLNVSVCISTESYYQVIHFSY